MSTENEWKVIVVGEDEANLREGIAQFFSHHSPSTVSDHELEQSVDLVRDTCWGWFDESQTECVEHCGVAGPCSVERMKNLRAFATEVEKEDTKIQKFTSIHSKLKKLNALRDAVSGVEDWSSTKQS
jgi:hypothetical protein